MSLNKMPLGSMTQCNKHQHKNLLTFLVCKDQRSIPNANGCSCFGFVGIVRCRNPTKSAIADHKEERVARHTGSHRLLSCYCSWSLELCNALFCSKTPTRDWRLSWVHSQGQEADAIQKGCKMGWKLLAALYPASHTRCLQKFCYCLQWNHQQDGTALC